MRGTLQLLVCCLVYEEGTDVLASHTSKKNQNAMLQLAAALYGLTTAPGTGPVAVGSFGI